MKIKLIAGALLGAGMIAAAPVNAATLSISGGTPSSLPSNFGEFDPDIRTIEFSGKTFGISSDPTVETDIRTFAAGTDGGPIGGGLEIALEGTFDTLRVTLLGSESGRTNSFLKFLDPNNPDQSLNEDADEVGDFIDVRDNGSFVDFFFSNSVRAITNGGNADLTSLNLAFSNVFTGDNGRDAVVAFFGDGAGDTDFDDMIVGIQVIPLPAGLVLLLSALGGLGFVASRRRTLATT